MISIVINGKKTEIKEGTTAKQLLDQRSITSGAVWVNGKQLLKKEYTHVSFNEGDEVKILRLMSGG